MHGSASHVLVRPFVVFAARALGPGPARLRLVKLAHNLDHPAFRADTVEGTAGVDERQAAQQPTRHAA